MIVQRKENQFKIEQGSNTFIGERHDPYGFWKITGRINKKDVEFDGEYTSAEDAIKEVHRKLNEYKVSTEEKII